MKKCKKCGSATITGWDGVVKTSMAIERIQSDKMGVPMPPVPTKGHYQLYFGTPICSIPSHPPPATRHPPPATRHPPPADDKFTAINNTAQDYTAIWITATMRHEHPCQTR